MTEAPDGSIWGYSLFGGVVRIDRTFEVIASSGGDILEDRFIYSLAVGPDRLLYAFVSGYDTSGDDSQGWVYVFDEAAQFVRSFEVTEQGPYLNQFVIGTHLFFLPDGNLILIDPTLATKVVDTEGNVVGEGPQYDIGDIFFIYATAMDMADDGTLYVLEDNVLVFSPTGQLVAQYGAAQDLEAERAFYPGEIPVFNRTIAVFGPDQIIVGGSNFIYSQLSLIDVALLASD